MGLSNVSYCRSVPDDDPLFRGVPPGSSLEVDGVLYIRSADWLSFLEAVSAALRRQEDAGFPDRRRGVS
ncbi:MAG TPA: hypothetical protein VGE12_01850 [Noviherbaspirillum sp.]